MVYYRCTSYAVLMNRWIDGSVWHLLHDEADGFNIIGIFSIFIETFTANDQATTSACRTSYFPPVRHIIALRIAIWAANTSRPFATFAGNQFLWRNIILFGRKSIPKATAEITDCRSAKEVHRNNPEREESCLSTVCVVIASFSNQKSDQASLY